MLRAELKGIDWYEDGSIKEHYPDPEVPFIFSVNLSVGTHGNDGADLFVVDVCNVLWIELECAAKGILLGARMVIVSEFDYYKFEDFVRRYCSRCSGPTWADIAHQIERLGRWEFEGMNHPS